jgi:predicted permease
VALWVLRVTVPASEVDAIAGDLEETAVAEGRGGLWFLGQAVLFALSFGAARVWQGLRAARRATSIGEILREGRTMEGWWKDLKVSGRGLMRRPGFTLIVVATLGLGIGANTAIFSVVQGALLWELPYPDPDRLVRHSDGYRDWGAYGSSMSLPNILDLREGSTQVQAMEAYTVRSVNLAGEERPERVRGLAVGPDFFRVLGMPPALGRDFAREDNVRGAADVVILAHELWQDHFGGDPEIMGRTVLLDAYPFAVIGVMPEAFEFRGNPRLFFPIQYEGQEMGRLGRGFNAIGRLAPTATLEGARTELQAIFRRLEEEYPEANQNWQTWIDPLKSWMVGSASTASLRLLAGAVLLVLLISCVNVANLLLVRSESRQKELAVRVAMGAGRGRLLPVFLSESLLLGLGGGVLGLALAYWGVPVLVSLYGSALPRADAIGIDGGVLAFALGLSVATGLLVGALPALRTDVSQIQGHLKEGTRAVSRSGRRIRQGLVVVEMALSVMLAAGAALLMQSFWNVTSVDSGLAEPEQVLVAGLSLSSGTYGDAASQVAFSRELAAAAEAAPGVTAAGLTSRLPLNGGYNITDLFVHNDDERVAHFVELRYVTPGFFAAAGLDLVAGRGITYADGDEGINVLVTRELAVQLFGGPDAAVDQFIRPGHQEEPFRVVGVAEDIRDMGLTRRPPPGIYFAVGPQARSSDLFLLVRASGDPTQALPGLREAVARLDPALPLYGTRLLSDVIDGTVRTRRFSMSLFALFAGLALLLGAIGIYGVMSFTVSERTREVGVRLALGARRDDVVRMVLRSGLQLTLLGLLIGVSSAVAASRLLADLLFEVEGTDPLIHGGVGLLLTVVALAACYLPARRASSVNPVEALRHE